MLFGLFFLQTVLAISNSSSIATSEIIEHLKNGQKFSEIVDSSLFLSFTGEAGEKYLNILEHIKFHEKSCYNDILYNLKFDCEKANEEQQRLLALRFTQCYYNITGKLDIFPTNVADDLKTSFMQQSVYSTFTSMKTHWKNLCQFSKQNIFTEETSTSLLDVYHEIFDSMSQIMNFARQINETEQSLNESLTKNNVGLGQNVESAKQLFVLIDNLFTIFDNFAHSANLFLITIRRMEYYTGILLFALFFAMYIPFMLFHVIASTAIVMAIDYCLNCYFPTWNSSTYRSIMRWMYGFVCLAYPINLLIKYIIHLTKYSISLIQFFVNLYSQEKEKRKIDKSN